MDNVKKELKPLWFIALFLLILNGEHFGIISSGLFFRINTGESSRVYIKHLFINYLRQVVDCPSLYL